jgi:hypothetical protein
MGANFVSQRGDRIVSRAIGDFPFSDQPPVCTPPDITGMRRKLGFATHLAAEVTGDVGKR